MRRKNMRSTAPRLKSALLWMAAATAAYLYVLNRLLIQVRDRRYKSLMVRAGGLSAAGIGALTGWLNAGSRWFALPSATLAAAFMGEVRRQVVRAKHRGSAPVAEDGPAAALSRPNTTTDLVVRRYEVAVPAWDGPPIRVAHLSDLHLNGHLPLSYYQDAMRRVAESAPDLLFITGDFVTRAEYTPLLPSVLGLAAGRLGSFAVLGNHDAWADAPRVAETVAASGVRMIGGQVVRIPIRDGLTVAVHGWEHPWSDEAGLNAGAQAPLPAGPQRRAAGQPACLRPQTGSGSHPSASRGAELAFLLTHTPDNIYRLNGSGIHAVFAGHYHGGQICLPGLGPLVVPSKFGRLLDRGHFVFGDAHLFVTAGVGSAEPPVRLWCQPDILIVDFLPGRAEAAAATNAPAAGDPARPGPDRLR